MFIHEMTTGECLEALAKFEFGRLGCARDNQPYVVPINFTYHERRLYLFSKVGRKIDCMRANPQVCVEVDELISSDHWLSIVVSGHYEEIPDTPENELERKQAHRILQHRAEWWEPASTVPQRHDVVPKWIFCRIHVDQITGYRAVTDPSELAKPFVHGSGTRIKGGLWGLLSH